MSATLSGLADLDFVEAVLDAAEQLCAEVSELAPEDRSLFLLALSEIATNIAVHSRPPDGTVRVQVNLEIDSEALQAEFIDTADPATIDMQAIGLPDVDQESGRGLALAQSAVDELSHVTADGNVWRLRRLRR